MQAVVAHALVFALALFAAAVVWRAEPYLHPGEWGRRVPIDNTSLRLIGFVMILAITALLIRPSVLRWVDGALRPRSADVTGAVRDAGSARSAAPKTSVPIDPVQAGPLFLPGRAGNRSISGQITPQPEPAPAIARQNRAADDGLELRSAPDIQAFTPQAANPAPAAAVTPPRTVAAPSPRSRNEKTPVEKTPVPKTAEDQTRPDTGVQRSRRADEGPPTSDASPAHNAAGPAASVGTPGIQGTLGTLPTPGTPGTPSTPNTAATLATPTPPTPAPSARPPDPSPLASRGVVDDPVPETRAADADRPASRSRCFMPWCRRDAPVAPPTAPPASSASPDGPVPGPVNP